MSDEGMAEEKVKQNIWIAIADLKPIPLSIVRDDEPSYREAEKMVNTLWQKWLPRFKDSSSEKEIMGRIAFQFARLYAQAYRENANVAAFLKDLEKSLDDIVVKV